MARAGLREPNDVIPPMMQSAPVETTNIRRPTRRNNQPQNQSQQVMNQPQEAPSQPLEDEGVKSQPSQPIKVVKLG